ncbi:hypothetical protein PDJ95_28350 [Bacillus cereus]|nr:hypothetical protein [Bacillus cereus]
MDKSWSGNSTQLLQEIDWKMRRIESILQQVSIDASKSVPVIVHFTTRPQDDTTGKRT